MTDAMLSAGSIQPVAEVFTTSASALWATTYNVDLALFNEFLLPRLGDPPLNVVVLADHRRLNASLERIPSQRVDTLALVNRRWLLRGIRPGGQAQIFHPKSYLTVGGKRASLLVGSGNLSAGGLDEGREVFTVFRSGSPVGDMAISTWRAWMRRIVELAGDVTLAGRFRDLEEGLPTLTVAGDESEARILHNLDKSIARQLTDTIAGPVDEVLLTAPYYDADAEAVGALLGELKPRKVSLFMTGSTSVDGGRLATVLKASRAQINLFAYEPDRFVHAKLVGVLAGDRAWLLSGSANLSRAALTRTTNEGGNVELAVLTRLDPERVRSTLLPPGMTAVPRGLDSLALFTFNKVEESRSYAVRLMTAVATSNGRIEIRSDPPAGSGWLLDDLTQAQPLVVESSGRIITVGPLVGRLVQLVDAGGGLLSNRVVVDDPAALAAALTAAGGSSTRGGPPELAPGDLDSKLGLALLWLHRNLVMDVTERITTAPAGAVGEEEEDQRSDDDLWERLERDQLARDPRVQTYGRIWNRNGLGGAEPIIELLETLHSRTLPESTSDGTAQSVLAQILRLHQPNDDESESAPRRWAPTTRIRVRARNVLRRWAVAQTDPRLVWVDPLAPAGNFALIAVTLAGLRLDQGREPDQVVLTEEDLDDLWLRWLRPFVGTGEGDGWLDRLDSHTLGIAHERLREWVPEVAAALCWLATQPRNGYRERAVTWQPVLAAALAHDLLDATDTTASFVSEVAGRTITRAQIDDQLVAVMGFIDDDLWCARTADELALDGLKLRAPPGAAHVQIRLDIRGVTDPLLDPRVPRLVVAARRYRRCDGVAVYAEDAGWRLVVAVGDTIAYLPNLIGTDLNSTLPVTEGVLERLTGAGGVLASLFASADQVA